MRRRLIAPCTFAAFSGAIAAALLMRPLKLLGD
jgi:hypothetical protein